MDITTLIGVVSGFALMVIGILWGGGALKSFYDLSSVVIVIGGMISAIVTSFSVKELTSMFKVAGKSFKNPKNDINSTIAIIVDMANIARKEGLLALEEKASTLENPFMKKAVNLMVDGTDMGLMKDILEAEMSFTESRHAKGASVFDNLAAYGPAFGMLGTLIGLINMLKNLSDPAALGPGMSVALVTTFYGSLLANVVCTPISTKLKLRSSEEIMHMEMIMEGILSIHAGENPRIISEKLNSFLSRTDIEKNAAKTPAKADE